MAVWGSSETETTLAPLRLFLSEDRVKWQRARLLVSIRMFRSSTLLDFRGFLPVTCRMLLKYLLDPYCNCSSRHEVA
jgi:hypothetical protein